MATYQVRLLNKKTIAENTVEFILEKPAGLSYRAGQFFDIILPKASNTAAKSDYVHGFSFASAPFETTISAATRMRETSAFKQALKQVPDGTKLEIEAVWGDFTLKKTDNLPVVYLIGGIGITPVRSMLVQALHENLNRSLTLIYANHHPASAAYINELDALAKHYEQFDFVPVYSEKTANAEQGPIDAALIQRHVANVKQAIYYLSGPPNLVRAMREILMEMGVDEDYIRTEEFDGY